MTPMQHFSVNAASETFERTRRTIKRALRGVEPDSYERSQPRWALSTIEAALARNTAPKEDQRYRVNGTGFPTLDAALEYDRETLVFFCEFNKGLAQLRATESLAKRRKMVGPLTKIGEAASGQYSEHCDKVGAYSRGGAACMDDYLFQLLADACEWSTDKVWAEYWKLTPDEE
jgi:hypothetical protein